MADQVVREGITHVLTKMGIMGIRLKIAIKNATPQEFELINNYKESIPNTVTSNTAFLTNSSTDEDSNKDENEKIINAEKEIPSNVEVKT